MIPLSSRIVITVFIALVVPATLSIWLLSVPDLMSASTFSVLAALLISVAAVTLMSARNAGPTGSLGQLLYETEHPVQKDARRRPTSGNSW